MDLNAILQVLPVLVTSGEELLAVLGKLREAALTHGLDQENALLDRVITEATVAKASEDARRGL